MLAALLALVPTPVQDAVPVLEVGSRTLDVVDGAHLYAGIWTADPTAVPDVYHARRSGTARTITFRGDLGELSIAVEPGRQYDLVVRLASGEECPTRISTARQPYRRSGAGPANGVDVIPFRFDEGWIRVTASVNGSEPLDLMFDTGADNLVLFPSALAKGCELRLDGSQLNAGLGGTLERRTSADNRLELAGLVFEHERVLLVEQQIGSCDGILGYVAFEDKVLEIDPDERELRLHDALPARTAGLARLPLRHVGTVLALEAGFDTGRGRGSEWLVVDSGSAAALHLGRGFDERHGVLAALETLGTSESRGVGPGVLRNEIVLLPELALGPHALADVPAHVTAAGQELSSGDLLGMQVLERFHLWLDLEGMQAALEPAARFGEPFDVPGGPPPLVVIGGAAALAFVVALALRRLRRGSRRAAVVAVPPT